MKVKVHPLPEKVVGKVCVLVDALRATCTISAALSFGATGIIPVGSVEEAKKLKGDGAVLAGERKGKKIKGFDLGNSPFDMEQVSGKEVILTTSNGTRAVKMLDCEEIVAASFPNLLAVLDFLKGFDEVDVVCSGDDGKVSLEDFLLAGKIAMLDRDPKDVTRIASIYASSVTSVNEEILKSSHALELIELGFRRDVEFCSNVGTISEIPVLRSGVFRRLRL